MLTNVETSSKFLEATGKAISLYNKGFVFSALYGSQNYGLATPTSDVDIKVGFLPSPQEVLLTAKRQAFTHTENGSTDNTILAKDLRDVFTEFYKQNLNFLEVLATPYFFTLDKNCDKLFEELRTRSDEVARYYERGFYLCNCGLFNKLDVDFQKDRVDKKKFTFGLYLRDFLDKYSAGVPFNYCFDSSNVEFYQQVRSLDNEEFVKSYDSLFRYEYGHAGDSKFAIGIQALNEPESYGTSEYNLEFALKSEATGELLTKVYVTVVSIESSTTPED